MKKNYLNIFIFRLLVERILHTCLVPYLHPPEDRMKKMYQLYATVDDHAVKAFNELLKCQCMYENCLSNRFNSGIWFNFF